MYYRQFQKFLLVIIDNFGPNRFGKICAEVTFSVKENIKQAFLREVGMVARFHPPTKVVLAQFQIFLATPGTFLSTF